MHDSPVHCSSIHRLRVLVQVHQSGQRLRSCHTLHFRGFGRCFCRWLDDSVGCHQDSASDSGNGARCRDTLGPGHCSGSINHQATAWLCGFLPWATTEDHHHHAQHSNMLVRAPSVDFVWPGLTIAPGLHTKWPRPTSFVTKTIDLIASDQHQPSILASPTLSTRSGPVSLLPEDLSEDLQRVSQRISLRISQMI